MLARTQLCKDQPWSLYNTQLSALHIKLDKHHILPSSTEVSEQVLNSLGGDGHSCADSRSRDHHSLSPHGEPNPESHLQQEHGITITKKVIEDNTKATNGCLDNTRPKNLRSSPH
ncbi:hypothetical protein E2C01_000805 [Portunus trituberculatus]|uniref:Uncharacterized protein n=1 Tax=Portunus trituberculatus TaxID=210409 RepID=A0A5B7CFA4_PORTR|nr:hypothetical protein [Portunus trituberculatus]